MDIQKEREAFEEKFNHLDLSFVDDLGYCEIETQTAWEAWQAAKSQAVPEGFVLVSKDPAKDTIIEMASVCLLPRCKNGDVEYLNLDEAKEVYQAAIKAQEQAND